VLAAHEETRQRLISAGLVSSHGELGSIRLDDPALRKMVACAPAAHGSGMPVGGQVKYRGTDGVVLNLAMIPITERGGGEAPWLPISEPAGLLFVTAPEDLAKERVRRLADSYGLTAAEAAVSVEIAKGDGRAAVAARLGIRETTVRSHLSAIFDKLGIHRQAELTRLVSGG
jgi:DNA-binding CsgD family transcriptional regulator